MVKVVKYFCDLCGRKLDKFITKICKIKGDDTYRDFSDSFNYHTCRWCFKEVDELLKLFKKNKVKIK